VSSDREAGVSATLSEGIADDRPGILGRLLAINPYFTNYAQVLAGTAIPQFSPLSD